ncbi:MAG: hypothetical protein JOS17DRAFT_819104 [Linnemannia elongata]|nr:MAG: hypothetical protein JOS17DRAFT_819104 [Linnemannia elongata]
MRTHLQESPQCADSLKLATSAATSGTGKHKKNVCTIEEPWRLLTLMDIRAPDMNREPALLFDHAVASLKQYEYQDVQDKNVVLVEIAQYDT